MDRSQLKEHLRALLKEAKDIFFDELITKNPLEAKKHGIEKRSEKTHLSTAQRYQTWYTKALPLMRQLARDRFEEFVAQYQPDPKRKNADWLHYTIQDYIRGIAYRDNDPFISFSSQFQHQILIFEAVLETSDQRFADLESVVHADLFGHELEAAEELLGKKHVRAAGALAGVILEAHLAKICRDRGLKSPKKAPTISEYNDLLKQESVFDVPTWRFIQRLGDIRNLSACQGSRANDR